MQPSALEEERDLLVREARSFASHLVARAPSDELCLRYADANRVLIPTWESARETSIVGFARRHPWSVSYLDAASGLVASRGLLRSKLLILAAVLETSPEYADEFLPRTSSLLPLVTGLVGRGILGVLRAAVGLLLVPIAARS
ncbi:MAG: hypothetical protein ABFS46_06355 [Myxococcota bacterium]